jgi:hypothetical protein
MLLRFPCLRLLLLGAALALVAVPRAQAAWPSNPAVNVPLCTAAGDQLHPSVVSDGAGGSIVTWMDPRGGTTRDIYAQRISANGTILWSSNGAPICTAVGDQQDPVIASDGAGGAIIVWRDYRSSPGLGSPGYCDVYAQRVSASGAVQWATNGVAICTDVADQVCSDIMADGSGGAFITWMDYRNTYDFDIYMQRISASGTPQWTSGGVGVCAIGYSDFEPFLVADGAGGVIVSWLHAGSPYDIRAQRLNGSGAVQWTANGVIVCNATGDKGNPRIVADGTGGAIISWQDARGTDFDIYAQRLNGSGAVQWTTNGVALCATTGVQQAPRIVTDGAGGAIVVWDDLRSGNYDIYAQRISAAGAVQWAANGVGLCTAIGNQSSPALVADGAGGAIAAWHGRSVEPTIEIFAQRISAAGAMHWAVNGVAVCTATGDQVYPVIDTDGAAGAIVTWLDWRSGNEDIYAQRVDQWGYLGAHPMITSVYDVPGDQGGYVTVAWSASSLDVAPSYAIVDYGIWRQVTTSAARSAMARGAGLLPEGAPAPSAPLGTLRVTVSGTAASYWELVETQVAQGLASYSHAAPTIVDFVPSGDPYAPLLPFMVEARGTLPGQSWFSDPKSGYSVDNLAPEAPTPFTGEYHAGTVTLHWGVSTAADFATFRVHRGQAASFVPGPSNLVVTQADTGYVDAAGCACYYKLCAVDIHDNVGPYTLLQYSEPVDVQAPGPPQELALSAPAPNPLRGSTTLRLALPRAARVSLAVYDQQGRRVRTLAAGTRPAGEHAIVWDGRDESGRAVASGIYFVRCDAEGRAFTRRLAAVR